MFPAEPVASANQMIHLILTQIHRAVQLEACWCTKRKLWNKEGTADNGRVNNLHYNSGRSSQLETETNFCFVEE